MAVKTKLTADEKFAAKFTYQVGQPVEISGAKDAVVSRLVMPGRGKKPALYTIQYTVDDQLESANPTGKRYSQPRFENEFTVTD